MNLDELAKKYGGGQVQTGASRFDDLAQKYGGSSLEADIPQPTPVKDAGFSLGDIAKSFGMGAAGSTKALTDVAGAGNFVSSKLEGATESLQKSLTPERQAEMERQAARMKAAEESGSILQEIKAGALNVAEAPLQSAAQALGSFVPYLPAMLASPIAAAMRLTAGSKAAIATVARASPEIISTAQGAGAVKSSLYEGVLQAEIEAGVDPEVAKQKATAAQDFFGKNFDQIALGAGLGYVGGRFGAEKFFTPAGRAGAAPGLGRRVTGAVVGESLPEAAQGGQERLAQNIGLQREGYDVDTFKGVAGAATQEALTGALGAAPIAALSRPDPTIAAKKEEDKFKQEEEEFRKQFGKATPVDIKEPEAPTEFPGGYTATRRELSRQDVPESFGIFAKGSDSPLTTVSTQEEAQAKLQTLTEIRQQEQERLMVEGDNLMKPIEKARRDLEIMEATGRASTDEYVQAKALLAQQEQAADDKFAEIFSSINNYAQPLTLAPVGTRTDVQSDYVVKRGDQEIGAFPTLQDAELKLREIEPEPFKQVEQEARVKTDDRVQQLKQTLTPMLEKFGLRDVGLNVVDRIENNAGGRYLDSLIDISLTEQNPVQTMRHEALHALKDLQFFTPQQYKVLEERANKQWIKEYLQDQTAEIEVDGKPVQMSRLDAYKRLGYSQEAIVEEAIADAFGAYARGATPPPGMIAALFKKLQNFFLNFGQALRGAGFESADDVFQRVERGELKSRKPKSEPKTKPEVEQEEADSEAREPKENKLFAEEKEKPKYSLAGEGVPMSTRPLMERQTAIAQQDLGLNTEAGRSGSNNVRDIAKALNQQTLEQLGAMNRNKLTQDESTRISEAIADEVAYQLQTTAKTGTGLGWYSNNYPNAVKRLARRFPELGTSQYARSVFSALVAVTSNGERVTKNIDNAIKLYSKLRSGKRLVAMGNRRPTALQNNLKVIQDLMEQHGPNFEKVLLKEITVSDMNAQLRKMGKKTDGSYLANTVVPAAAVYFGPKLGAFYANLSGSEGYLTMDLWWTRSINRMRGLLIPKATSASITKFRDMMESPGATRDEVIAATIPLRNKYEEYDWNSELEHLVKAKEPAKNAAKPAWFKKAEEAAGDAYEQLLFEHNLEKMANTIYKNEFEMLQEAPFTATDRKFMYDAARKAQTLLRNDGIDLSLADIQAALWYYEKRLYAKLSGRKADDIGYEEAIIAQANQGSGRARPSVVFDQRADRGDDASGKVSDSETVRGQPPGSEEKLNGKLDETTRPNQPAVRPSPRGGEKSNYGPKYSLREDVRSYRGRDEVQPGTHTRKGLGDGTSVRVLGAKPIAQFTPIDLFKGIVDEHGFQSPVFYEISGKDAGVYEQAIQDSKNSNRYGAAVYVYSVDEYSDMRLFMTEDGKSGIALKGDDIVSVFSGPPHKGSVNSSIQLAVQEGGRRLDAFATVLPQIYHANGFKIVGRMKWNEDYKPDNWDKKTFAEFNGGEPDVVYMSYDPDDNRTILENPGKYFDDPDELAQAQRDAVDTYFKEGTGYGTARQTETSRRLKTKAGELPKQGRVRGGLRILDDETRAKYPNLEKPVAGLPATVKVDGVDVTFGPYLPAREAAVFYAEEAGLPYRQQASYHKLDPSFSKMLASSYARMIDEPNAPQVKAAYKAWADETIAQYKAMLKTGIEVEFFPNAIDTYGNPRNSILDVLNNNHLYVFPADGGFGQNAITDDQIRNNPALALTDIVISGRKARVVEVFRATHDFFGHIKEGFGFRAEGEENAFQSHVRMYSPLAARAMTAGTRGQNSEVNFGRNAEFNKTASGKETKYADQKIGLMPEWASTKEIEPDVTKESKPEVVGKGVVLGDKQPDSISVYGSHYGKAQVSELDASKYGTGIRGAESRRLERTDDERIKRRVYFYIAKTDGSTPTPESGVGQYVYTQKFDNILGQGPEMGRLFREANGDSNNFESLIVDAGYDGYAIPEMGMMVILNHNVPVNYVGPRSEVGVPKLSLRTVSSPAFKQWFGDSKIVNADGTPKVMYHGLAKDTTDFTRKTERGAPIFLTDDPDFAAKFAADSYLQVADHPEKYLTKAQLAEGEKKAISAIRKDYKKDTLGKEMIASIQDGSPTPEAREYLQKEYVNMLPTGPHIMPLYVRAERPFDYENASHVRQVAKWYKENIGSQYVPIGRGNMVNASNLPAILKDGQWEAIETDDIQDAIKSLGFDSFYVKEHGRKNLAVYDPNQVKSATGNTGQYSRTDNDVRYSLKNVAFPSAEEAKKAVAKTSVPKTDEFKLFIAGNQWIDEDGDPKVFYHATAREFFEFDPDLRVVYLSDTPEAAEPFGKIAEDRLRQEIYRALNKQEKLDFFQRVVDDAVKADKMSEAEASTFMRKADRKIPEYGNFGDLESEVLEALIDLSPTRMSIMPLYARAETPFDFEDKEQVARVMNWVKQNVESKSEFADQKFNALQGSIVQGTPQAIEQEGVQRALRRLGFDGYTVRKRGQQKSYAVYTSEQVKSVTGNLGDFSRESKDVRYSLKNTGFHSGDLGYGRDTALGKMGGRSTGHFGTGVYFVSDPEKLRSRFDARADRPMAQVDLSQFNLARPSSDFFAQRLHDGLKIVNSMVGSDYKDRSALETDLQKAAGLLDGALSLRQSDAEVRKAILTAVKSAMKDLTDDVMFTSKYIDSASTRVMKSLGFDGIDVRHIPKFDTTEYGTVVYRESLADNPAVKYSLRQALPESMQKLGITLEMIELYKDHDSKQRIVQADKEFATRSEKIQATRAQNKFFDAIAPLNNDSMVLYRIGNYVNEINAGDEKYSLPTIPQNLQDRMGETTTRAQRKTVIQSIVDAIRPTSAADFRAKALNRYNQMSVNDKKLAEQRGGIALLADESAESAALMSDLGAGVAASAMGFDDRNGGIPVLRNGITTIDKRVKGLIASLAPLAQHGDPAVYQRYQYWAMVKRGQRLNNQGKLTGIDTADVAFAEVLEQAHPEFVSVQKDLIAFNNGVVQYMVDTGVLSQERGNMYTKYADYIPFYRQMDGDETLGPNLFQSLSGVKPPKKLKGADVAEAPIADFLETMVRNTQSSIQAGIKNYAAQRAINVAVQVKAPGMGAERLNFKSDAPDVINVLEKGNLVSYRTPDTLLVNAMMSLNQSELPFMGFLSAPADLLRNLVTKEPGFMMANMLRDSLSAWVTSGVKMTPIAGTVINFGKAIARTSPGFEALLDAGIIGGYEFNENIEKSGFKLEKDLATKAGQKAPLVLRPFKSVWDALGKGTTASDAATRALIYERVLAETGNEAEALYRALEVMNFHRKGSSPLIRVLTAAVPFFNARLQGLDVFYRASFGRMNNKDAAAIQRQFFVRGFTMMALSGMYWMLVSDDEEYKKQEQETKDNNWIIPAIGAKIPIPFEVGVLFKVIPERIAAYLFGNDTGEDLKKSMIRSAVSTFAFNPIPQTVKPVLEAYVDYNMFTMRPILGQGMKDIEPEYQVGPSTSNFAIALAQNLGLSPIKVDHIIKGYTGTIGMYAIDTIDMVMDQFGDSPKPTKRFEQLPIIKRFASDPEARGYVTQYYELKDAVDTTVRTMNLLEKTNQPEEYIEYVLKNQGSLAFKDYISDTEKSMKELREMKIAIRSSSMDGDEKRDALLAISQMESALTSNIQEIKKTIASVQ